MPALRLFHDRSMITIAALFSAGLYPQLRVHLSIGKDHGLTKQEAVEIVTQLAFYCGWPKAWSTFPLIQEVFGDEEAELDGVPSNLSYSPLEKRTPMGNILSARAIWLHCPLRRYRSSMLPLSRAAGTTGISIMPARAAGRC